jgi:tocopherol cyclase
VRLAIFLSVFFILGTVTSNATDSRTERYNSLLWKTTDHSDWYEWWYFKVVDPKTQKAFYFCYGLVNPWDTTQEKPTSRAYVNAGSFSEMKIIEQRWAPQDFRSNSNEIINIGAKNHIGKEELVGDIMNEKGQRVRWDLHTQIDWSFNAMGWTMFVENASGIYWYPAQASLKMSGWIDFNGERIELKNALGYQDRNWGRSFPHWWAWIVSNNFKNSPGTVFASGGGRPKVFNQFEIIDGYTLGLRYQNKEYAFRFTDGDNIQQEINFGKWHIDAINGRNERLVVDAYAPREKFLMIPFASPQGPDFKDYEALRGQLHLRLYTRDYFFSPWKLIRELDSDETGIEFGSFDEHLNIQKVFGTRIKLH